MRHLLDIAALSRAPEGIDWTALRRLARTRLCEHAVDTHLVAAARLAGAKVPEAITRRVWARLHHARRRAQHRWPRAATALAGLAAASEAAALRAHRAADRADQRRMFGEPRGHRSMPERLERLRHILGQAADGKV